MAAYAALVSLLNDLEPIPNHPIHSFSFDDKQLSSLSQTVEILIDFIETYDSHGEAAQVMESQIASVAHAAHDVIESHIVDQIHSGSTRCGTVRSYFLLDLERAIDDMEFVKRKTTQFKAKSGLKAEQTTYSLPSASLKNSGMVGFDEVVLQLVEVLARPSNQRLVVPIAGMGGLEQEFWFIWLREQGNAWTFLLPFTSYIFSYACCMEAGPQQLRGGLSTLPA